jgi:hypothetical protein
MARKRKETSDDPHQLRIDWTGAGIAAATPALPIPSARPAVEPLVQRLPWDFKTSFPQPCDEAIDNGVMDETYRQPENLKSLHENYARQCLATLAALDKVMDARRRGIDPGTGNKPRTHASRERLRKYLAEEPARLEHTFDVLIGTYGDAFGQVPGAAFKKAIIAWHAGIEVAGESADIPELKRGVRKERKARASSCLPVPKPLSSSVAAGIFGRDENGKPIRPDADEVRAITEDHAERMIEMNDAELQSAVTMYAGDFGNKAAAQLERYVRRQQHSR